MISQRSQQRLQEFFLSDTFSVTSPCASRKIADTYHAWRGDKAAGDYEDVPGFCKSTTLDDIRHHNHILTPGRYVGAAEVEDDGEPFEEKMARLTAELREQTAQSKKLDKLIWANLEDIGYGL